MSDKNSTGLRLKRGRYKTIPGKYYRTPKEIWNFRTAALGGSPESSARAFVVANAALFGLEEGVSELAVRRVIRSLGATHVIFRQVHDRYRVHRGYVTVHMDRSGRVYLSKNRSVPPHLLPGKFERIIDREEAVRPRAAVPAEARPCERRARDRKAVVSPRRRTGAGMEGAAHTHVAPRR